MPGRGNNREFPFVSIDAEILRRFVVCVQPAYGNNLHARTQNRISVKLLLQPELLQGHFTAAFHFCFVLTAFLFLYLYRTLGTAVFKLNLCAHAPAVTEIVTHIDDHVRQVKLPVMVVLKFVGVLAVTQVVIAVPAMLGCHLSVSAYGKPPLSFTTY